MKFFSIALIAAAQAAYSQEELLSMDFDSQTATIGELNDGISDLNTKLAALETDYQVDHDQFESELTTCQATNEGLASQITHDMSIEEVIAEHNLKFTNEETRLAGIITALNQEHGEALATLNGAIVLIDDATADAVVANAEKQTTLTGLENDFNTAATNHDNAMSDLARDQGAVLDGLEGESETLEGQISSANTVESGLITDKATADSLKESNIATKGSNANTIAGLTTELSDLMKANADVISGHETTLAGLTSSFEDNVDQYALDITAHTEAEEQRHAQELAEYNQMLAEQKQAAEDSYAMDEDTIYEVCTRIDKDEDSADIPVVVTSDSAVKQHNWA